MRSVVAIDPSVGAVSVARIVMGEELPRCGVVGAPDVRGHWTPGLNTQRWQRHALEVVNAIEKGGTPDLVVMSKLDLWNLRQDPTGPRRAGLWWEIVRQLTHADIPTAEVSMMTTEKVVTGAAKAGREGYTALGAAVRRLYPGIEMPDDPYRPTTVGLAICGAVVAGIETPLDVTEDTLDLLSRGNDFPIKYGVPTDLADWAMRVTRASKSVEEIPA